jgi:hypothetical protein
MESPEADMEEETPERRRLLGIMNHGSVISFPYGVEFVPTPPEELRDGIDRHELGLRQVAAHHVGIVAHIEHANTRRLETADCLPTAEVLAAMIFDNR